MMMSDWIPGEVRGEMTVIGNVRSGELFHDQLQADRAFERNDQVTIGRAHTIIDDLRAKVATLTADLARVTAERDKYFDVGCDLLKKIDALRAAGLDPEGGPVCTPDPTS
jgi:hypothetical protein